MKTPNFTLLLVLWLVCQQASAVVSGIYEADSKPKGVFSDSCHDPAIAETTSTDIVDNSLITVECCEIDCECSINGCQLLLGNMMNTINLTHSTPPIDIYYFRALKTPAESLFRPPIFS